MKNLILNEGYQNNKNLFDKGLGSKIFTNKKTFVDLSSGQGTLLLGHNNRIFSIEEIDLSDFEALVFQIFQHPINMLLIFPII